jgi:hypothetical protein
VNGAGVEVMVLQSSFLVERRDFEGTESDREETRA